MCGLLLTDWGVTEHGSCLWVTELMGTNDQFDLPNCASCEALFRRVMAIEWQYRERVKDGSRGTVAASPSVSGSVPMTADEFDLFEGQGRVASSFLVAPSLVAYIAEETEKEADISKAARKAREEKLMSQTSTITQSAARTAQPPGPDDKGAGKGGRRGRR